MFRVIAFLASAIFLSTPAWAAITVGSISPYSFVNPSSGSSSTVYYATNQCGTPTTFNEGAGTCVYASCGGVQVDTALGYKTINVCRTSSYTGSGQAATQDPDGLVEFTVSTDKNTIPANGQVLAITIMVTSDGTNFAYVPIAYFNDSPCNSSGVSANNSSCNYISSNRGFASVFTNYGASYQINGTNKVGLFLRDICKAFNEQKNGNISGACSSTTPVAVADLTHATSLGAGGTIANFKLRAFVTLADSNTQFGRTDTSATATDDKRADTSDYGDFQVSVQGGAGWIKDSSTFNGDPSGCPLGANGNIYYPADSSILLNTSAFNDSTYASSDSGITKIIVLGNPTSLTNVSTTKSNNTSTLPPDFRTGNSISQELSVSLAVAQKLDGFTNTTSTEDHPYEIWFGLRDNAGVFASTKGSDKVLFPCGASGVRTFPIEGFLRQGKCFVATAAYHDSEVWGVKLLRTFRDQVLLKSDFGQEMVSQYYLWSPDAARWLVQHPRFELAVLVGLLPLQIFAFLMVQSVQHGIWLCLIPIAWIFAFLLFKRESESEVKREHR